MMAMVIAMFGFMGCKKGKNPNSPIIIEPTPITCNISGINYTVSKISDTEYEISNITNMNAFTSYSYNITTTVDISYYSNTNPINLRIYANDISSSDVLVDNITEFNQGGISKPTPITKINIKIWYLNDDGITENFLPFNISSVSFNI